MLPGDAGYDQDRLLSNPVFQFHPMAIIYCTTEVDVGLTLQLCRQENIPFSVRSGGHCTAGFSGSNGVIIDVKGLNAITVNAAARTSTCGTGVEFGRFQQVLDHYGLNVPGGECSDVCVGGYVQGGGFGVLLSVTFRVHPLRDVYGFALAWSLGAPEDIATAVDAIMFMQANYMRDSVAGPDMTLQIHIGFQYVDASQTTMAPFLMVRGMYAGDPARGPDMIAPMKALNGVLMDQFWEQVDSFYVMNHMLLHRPQGMPPMPPGPDPLEDKSSRYIARDLTPQEWSEMFTYLTTSEPNRSFGYMEVYGGAINAAPRLMNAFVHRDVAFNMVMDVFWKDETERQTSETFLAGWNQMVGAYWNGEVYQNYPSVVDPNYAAEYWGEAYPALQRVKAKYDPEGFFHFAQGVIGDAGAALPAGLPSAVASALDMPPAREAGLGEFTLG